MDFSITLLAIAVLMLSINMLILNRSRDSAGGYSSGFSFSDIPRTTIATYLIISGIVLPIFVYWFYPGTTKALLDITMPGASLQFENEINGFIKTVTTITTIVFPIMIGSGGIILANEFGAFRRVEKDKEAKA